MMNLTFKKQLINFDENEYNYAVGILNKVIEIINGNTDVLIKTNTVLTIDDIKLMAENPQEFKNKQYLRMLKEVCTMFAQNFDKVSKASYRWENPMFSDMANNKAQPLYDLCNDVRKLFYNGSLNVLNHIEIHDNIISPTLTAFEDLKEEYCSYTENERQNKINDIANLLVGNLKELEKMGVSPYLVPTFYYKDFSLNANVIKRL